MTSWNVDNGSELQLIAVPGGFVGTGADRRAVLRVVLLPRLSTGSLEEHGMAAWPPPQLQEPMSVVFRDDAAAAERRPVPVAPETDPEVQAQVREVWATITGAVVVAPRPPAAATRDVPLEPGVQVTETFATAARIDESYRTTAAAWSGQDTASDAAAVSRQSDVELAGWTPSATPSAPVSGASRPPADPRDLATVLGNLREFPTVLRAMGLVIELRLAPDQVPGDDVQVRVDWPAHADVRPALPRLVSRWTQCGRGFWPAGVGAEIVEGMVALDDTAWAAVTVDVDAAVSGLDAAATGTGPRIASARGLPSLRTAGMAITHRDRAASFGSRRDRARGDLTARTRGSELPVLTAHDLTLGYRIDVKVAERPTWYPLCARRATYTLRREGADDLVLAGAGEEEGHVKTHAAVRDENGVLRARDVVARWEGWSLVVGDPRRPESRGPDGRRRRTGSPYDLDWDFALPSVGTPPQRFGVNYEFRARVADIAGGGIAFDDPGAANRQKLRRKRFARHEPVLPPRLTMTDGQESQALSPGVAIDRLVVRSRGGPGAADAGAATPLAEFLPVDEDVRRRLDPPTGSVDQALAHGVLTGAASETFAMLSPFARGEAPLPDCASGGVAAFTLGLPERPAQEQQSESWSPEWPYADGKELRLAARGGAPAPVLGWAEGVLTVTLAPAEQVDVELSSPLPTEQAQGPTPVSSAVGLTDFELSAGLAAAAGGDAVDGRHPMLTPPRVVTCVHAVVTPLERPHGSVSALRTEGERVALLVPAAGTPLLGVHAGSTGQAEMTASWTEYDDDLRHPVDDQPVCSVAVARTDRTFGAPLRHVLPDTRHRFVRYRVTAMSRFGEYFTGLPQSDFTIAGDLEAVHVPSSARPAPPVVRSVVPAFTWSEEQEENGVVVRHRLGGRLRVELARPWFTSGEDEQLAVLFAPRAETGEAVGATEHATVVGRDPFWPATGAVPSSYPDVFSAASGVPRRLRLPGWDLPAPAGPVPSDAIDVAGHEVYPAGDSWYTDVAVDVSSGGLSSSWYCPMVQLVLARYQPYSLDGLFLSEPVRTDAVPLLPDRHLRIQPGLGEIRVTLDGHGPDTNRVDVLVETAPMGTDPDALVSTGTSPGGAPEPWTWRVVASTSGALGQVLSVPSFGLDDREIRRLRVRESEKHPFTDAGVAGTMQEIRERLVYTDIVPF